MRRRVGFRVRGRVQGVGFRLSARDEALARSLAGWVRNLPSGDVDGEVQGEGSDVDAFLAWCAVGPLGARVEHLAVEDRSVADSLTGFAIRR